MASRCRHIKVEIQGGETHCADCFGILASKPKRRRPTDTERLTWLLETAALSAHLPKIGWKDLETRSDIDRLMREESRRG